ncbi:MAG: hypothetical protein UR26_C0004G0019 [candidate division TM6 bacterium GW2011_GWF2_32_72]|nr:MAG: hypothetical protein UR26_C0004G0019 [candidate division TM6 bacterium GW2011_GWF2_32_72]
MTYNFLNKFLLLFLPFLMNMPCEARITNRQRYAGAALGTAVVSTGLAIGIACYSKSSGKKINKNARKKFAYCSGAADKLMLMCGLIAATSLSFGSYIIGFTLDVSPDLLEKIIQSLVKPVEKEPLFAEFIRKDLELKYKNYAEQSLFERNEVWKEYVDGYQNKYWIERMLKIYRHRFEQYSRKNVPEKTGNSNVINGSTTNHAPIV